MGMNERFRLNRELVTAHLTQEHRKISYLIEKLGVSKQTIKMMLYMGQVPRVPVLEKLATLMSCDVDDLLIKRNDKEDL